MLPLVAALIALCLTAMPVQAGDKNLTATPVSQVEGTLIAAAAPQLRPSTDATQLLVTEPGLRRQRASTAEHLRIDAGGELVSLAYHNNTSFTPWLGAGLNADTPAYRVGAGVGCDLGRATRLNVGYRFTSQLGREISDLTAGSDEEGHHFVVGLETSF